MIRNSPLHPGEINRHLDAKRVEHRFACRKCNSRTWLRRWVFWRRPCPYCAGEGWGAKVVIMASDDGPQGMLYTKRYDPATGQLRIEERALTFEIRDGILVGYKAEDGMPLN